MKFAIATYQIARNLILRFIRSKENPLDEHGFIVS